MMKKHNPLKRSKLLIDRSDPYYRYIVVYAHETKSQEFAKKEAAMKFRRMLEMER